MVPKYMFIFSKNAFLLTFLNVFELKQLKMVKLLLNKNANMVYYQSLNNLIYLTLIINSMLLSKISDLE